jgi:hypothetical protein
MLVSSGALDRHPGLCLVPARQDSRNGLHGDGLQEHPVGKRLSPHGGQVRAHSEDRGVIYSWERVWHPTDRALSDSVPYLVLLVELPGAGGIRMVGDSIGDQGAAARIGDPVRAVFEHHERFSLVQWERR